MRAFPLFLATALISSTTLANAAPQALSSAHDPLAFGPDHVSAGMLASGRHGMVVSAQHLASDAGAKILAQGGNAVDAAVAVGYALAVVYPAAGNIGGGGFMTLRLKTGQTLFIDFREHAPGAATATMYQDASGKVIPGLSTEGWKAVAIPGTVAGLDAILQKWGHLSREKVMAPAIALARDGFILNQGDADLLHTSTRYFQKDPYARAFYLRPDGTPLQAGDRLVQKDLANSLELVAKDGPKAFYEGPIAKEIVRASTEGGGLLQPADFTSYHIRNLEPIRCTYRGYTIDTAPPPSGGGVALCEILNILSGYDMHALGLHTAPSVQREVEAMRHAYSDRRDLGDPDFVHNPVEHLIDPAYAYQIRQGIPTDHALASSTLRAGEPLPAPVAQAAPDTQEKHETTQFSVLDHDGMAVSATYTLNGWFGAGVMGGHTGIWMNDEMDDFSSKPGAPNMFGIVGSEANAIAPGKTPLSSMSPSIVSRDGRTVMVIGSPGGSRIPTITLSVILGVIDYGLDIRQAVDLPRIHEQWEPSAVELEPGALSDETMQTLKAEGYALSPHRPWGVAEGILADHPSLSAAKTGLIYGAADPRHMGGAAVGE
ncbi:gamma-glutamyltransferase [Gluconobacter roseus]|uniref:Glutathione hydrolase proenzyme n=1 Tax=Gluconobacter roseus NBRC 3990 TaxID=1307950 RepID=A0A4Y3M5B1_9PROT|nr:gamma-glutamyltransferase [Gluconobacter roseus]KXV44493.1 gamma-glutamyltranspeptidase [Gluconobacter roseus]GBR44191.1 gamma-glutamyltranspeptidase [Gluconobacter roseus NBRC 3990]GEB02538.1 gamma-glutamyltranspeptidase [Gluconobacter roseus NBRC 3990]GLP92999.1 gamma-glutamyltranspeptidase [Gluconobacter roseus NBRC 3990]